MKRSGRQVLAAMVAGLAALLLCLAPLLAAEGPKGASAEGYTISVMPDRADGLYAAGQPIKFAVKVVQGQAADAKPLDQGEVAWTIQLNGTKELQSAVAPLDPRGAVIETRLDEPGCLMLQASYKVNETVTIRAEAGAAVEAGKLKPGLPAPDDFDQFWSAQKKRLAETPMNPKLTPVAGVPSGMQLELEFFDVQLDCPGGAPAAGYFARPKGAAAKSLPAIIMFHGAGVRSASLSSVAFKAGRGMLAMDVNAHGIVNGKPEDFYKALQTGELKDYPFRGLESREKCYFLGMYLRLMRAMEFLEAQPEWDGRLLIASGGSQGGAQALVAAGLNPRVTVVSAGLPALCDLAGDAAGRAAGWPIGRRELKDQERQTLRYFDVCHFAARTRARTVVRVGLIDRTCWPSGVLAMCNLLAGPKDVLSDPLSGHTFTASEVYRQADARLQQIIDEERAKAPKATAGGAAEKK